MTTFDFITVPIIVSIVYGGITLLKKAVNNSEKVLRFLPIIAAVTGAILGIVAYFSMPEIIPASNAFVAVLIGGASGLAATGTNQVFKQLIKKDENEKPDESKNQEDKKDG